MSILLKLMSFLRGPLVQARPTAWTPGKGVLIKIRCAKKAMGLGFDEIRFESACGNQSYRHPMPQRKGPLVLQVFLGPGTKLIEYWQREGIKFRVALYCQGVCLPWQDQTFRSPVLFYWTSEKLNHYVLRGKNRFVPTGAGLEEDSKANLLSFQVSRAR